MKHRITAKEAAADPPRFSAAFRDEFRRLVAWRRDVRRFKPDPVDPDVLDDIIDLACLSPSVGNSQPWRFVLVDNPARRARILESFQRSNRAALTTYSGKRAGLYARLKLSGLREAPCQLAVFVDETTTAGWGLGRRTMPETLHYSAVAAVQTLWLAARAHGLGVGWVSILEPAEVTKALDVPDGWTLLAYLCVGYPEEEHLDPELERHGWQRRPAQGRFVLHR